MSGPPPAQVIDLVVPPNRRATLFLPKLKDVRTRLVQSQAIGYDGVRDALPPGHTYANAASVHETATGEMALALILAAQRGIPAHVRAAEQGRWEPARQPGLADCTVLLLGYGGIGRAIEQRLLPFETTVVRVAHSARSDERGQIHADTELPTLLSQADIVVLAVPLTPHTRHLVDDAFLAAMREGALLVNIARGEVVDTDALLSHLEAGRLRAALDVTDPEPLPPNHPLFALPTVLITPHVGGASNAMMPRMVALLHEQINRMLRGAEPLNVTVRS